MEKIGVEAVVENLSGFLSDMGKMSESIKDLIPGAGSLATSISGIVGPMNLVWGLVSKMVPGTDLLSNAIFGLGGFFQKLGDIAGNLVSGALDVLKYTLGNLLADAIETVISKVKELIADMIDAGNEFQLLSIRLTGFNLPTNAVEDYSAAMGEATELTKEQLSWLQTLGAATPFDPQSIADIFVQARGYGFAADEAKRLTEDTINYTAAMGLGNQALESVVRNLGQMVSRGKITSTEIRDLSRSAFLPVADVLQRIVDLSDGAFADVAELNKKISEPGGGVPAEMFIEAFEQMVEQEPRYIGAAGRLSRAFLPAIQNVKELFTSIGGLDIVTPIFDVLGEKVASMVDMFVTFNEQGELVKTKRWDDLVDAATRLGDALSGVIEDVLGLLPSTEGLADGLIAGVSGIADWIDEHRGDIVNFFKGIGTVISTQVIPFLRDLAQKAIDFFTVINEESGKTGAQQLFENIGTAVDTVSKIINDYLMPAWNTFSDWVNENKPLINEFFTTLKQIVLDVIEKVSGKAPDAEGILGVVTSFMEYVVANKDKIEGVIEAFIQLNIWVLQVKLTFMAFKAWLATSMLDALRETKQAFKDWGENFKQVGESLRQAWESIKTWLAGIWEGIVNAFKQIFGISSPSRVFMQFGRDIIDGLVQGITGVLSRAYDIGASMVNSIASGIRGSVGTIISAARGAALSAYNAAKAALGMHSPSTLFVDIGENTMESMALGVQNMVSKAAATMQAATMQVTAAAVAGSTSVTNNTNNNSYNLTVNSGAQTEPIIQDYNMLQSLAGA